MRTLDDETAWAATRKDLRHTLAVLRAAESHGAESKEIQALLDRWYALDKDMTSAEDAVVEANARVAWCDAALDQSIEAFALDLEHAARGDRSALLFTSFFSVAPNEVIRLALGSEIERTAHFQHAAAEVKLPPSAQKSLARVEQARAVGRTALADREKAEAAEASMSIRVRRFKDDANAVRRSVYNALERHAINQGLDADYVDTFFLATPRRKAKRAPEAAPKLPSTPPAPR